MKLGAVRIFVHSLVAAQAFYEETLGLPRVAGGSAFGYCVFEMDGPGDAQLVIEAVSLDAPLEDRELVGRFTGVSFTVPDVSALHAALTERGVKFTDPPERQPWGGVLATFLDPSGNELQIVEMPGAT
ncbi:MAG: VOC family protein [Betaproteobacteria bacterium]|nr:VOC family protein [Betaproteobacteria bacterium]